MPMKRTITSVALAAAVSLGGGWGGWSALSGHTGRVHRSVMVNCEDQDVQPCITFDEGRWRRVDSYAPYASHTVRWCRKHRTYPCVTYAAGGNTFNYYWRGHF